MGIRLLFLEDNDEAADTLTAALGVHPSAKKFCVIRAATLERALHVVYDMNPDAAVVDLDLPDSEGLGAPNALRAAAPDLPIVVWTGHDNEKDALKLIQSGVQDYLIKGDASAHRICHSVLFAIERKQQESSRSRARPQ